MHCACDIFCLHIKKFLVILMSSKNRSYATRFLCSFQGPSSFLAAYSFLLSKLSREKNQVTSEPRLTIPPALYFTFTALLHRPLKPKLIISSECPSFFLQFIYKNCVLLGQHSQQQHKKILFFYVFQQPL